MQMRKTRGLCVVVFTCCFLLGCVKTLSKAEFMQQIEAHNMETVNSVAYTGSDDEWDYFTQYTLMRTFEVRIPKGEIDIPQRFPRTTAPAKTVVMKNHWGIFGHPDLFPLHVEGTQPIEVLSVEAKAGVLTNQVRVKNHTGSDRMLYWHTPQFCPATHPALLSIAGNSYVRLSVAGYNISSPLMNATMPFPQDLIATITSSVLLPAEGLSAGDYTFTATHPFDPAIIAEYTLSLANDLKEPGGFAAKSSEIPFPGEESPK